MQFVYDFDGLLVETKAAIKQAWRLVGVTPPKDFWKRHWRTWCDDEALYEKRNQVFIAKCLPLIKPLPMLQLAAATGGLILTSGAQYRVVACLSHLGVTNCMVKCGLDVKQKAEELNSFKKPGVYFDDNWEHVSTLRTLTQWHIVHIASQS